MVSKHQPTFKLILCYGTLSIAPCIAPQGGPNGVNHISMYLGYHNIEIKTRGFLKLNFGIWNIVWFLAGFCVKLSCCIKQSQNHAKFKVKIQNFRRKMDRRHSKKDIGRPLKLILQKGKFTNVWVQNYQFQLI